MKADMAEEADKLCVSVRLSAPFQLVPLPIVWPFRYCIIKGPPPLTPSFLPALQLIKLSRCVSLVSFCCAADDTELAITNFF